MSNLLISLFFGVGAGTWIYSKMFNRTGGDNKSALTVAALGGFTLFFLFFIILSFIM